MRTSRLTTINDFINSNSQFNKSTLNEGILVEDSLLESNDTTIIQTIDTKANYIHIPITQQIKEVRENEHVRFMNTASNGNNFNVNNSVIIRDDSLWPNTMHNG